MDAALQECTDTLPPFESRELEELLTHLAYEWLMLEHTSAEWQRTRDRVVLESLLLHIRNLRDFLFDQPSPSTPHGDKAVWAGHYLPAWASQKGSHHYAILWQMEAAINAQLSHLSRKRVDPSGTAALDENATALADAIRHAWGRFRSALEGSTWAESFQEKHAAKRRELFGY
ncbi:MAG: hypothetical protein IH965_10925 [Gemmatimonadetes bacterium]|nr:hypothetical protein [Gemmatimonadota bacterium]